MVIIARILSCKPEDVTVLRTLFEVLIFLKFLLVSLD